MPYSHYSDYPADILERAARIRLACFDVDGTLTDGRLVIDDAGGESKAFHVHDGLGLAMLRRTGVRVAFVTARAGRVAELRAKDLGVEAHTAVKDKVAKVRALAADAGVSMEQVAFMGDDLTDLAVMREVGLSVAPANAHPWTRERVHWRTLARGGEGAARELCDLLLAAQGKVEALIEAGNGGGGTQ